MFDDAELQLLQATVNCVAVLEHMSSGWKLDMRQSTRRALKYRREEGEILIINHEGTGWWDPLSRAKGDVFDLVQRLDRRLNFGQVPQVLWRLLGKAPSFQSAPREEKSSSPTQTIAERWSHRPRLRRGSSAAWRYLTDQRALTAAVIEHAAGQDAVREGHYGRRGVPKDPVPVYRPAMRVHAYIGSRSWKHQSTHSASPCWKTAGPTRSTSVPAAAWARARSRRCKRLSPTSPIVRMPSLSVPPTQMSPVTATPTTTPVSPTRHACGLSGCCRQTISIGTTY